MTTLVGPREVDLAVSFPPAVSKGSRTLLQTKISLGTADLNGESLRRLTLNAIAKHPQGKLQQNSELAGSSVLFGGRKMRWDQYAESVRVDMIPYTSAFPASLHVYVPRKVSLTFTFVKWPPYATRMDKNHTGVKSQANVIGHGEIAVSMEASPEEIRGILADRFNFDASFLVHAGRQIPLFGNDATLFFLYGAPLLVRLGVKDGTHLHAFTEVLEDVLVRSNSTERNLVSGWFNQEEKPRVSRAKDSSKSGTNSSTPTPVRANSAPMVKRPSTSTLAGTPQKSEHPTEVRKSHRLTVSDCLMPSFALRLKLAEKYGDLNAIPSASRLIFGGLDLTSTPRSPGHFGAQPGTTVWFTQNRRAASIRVVLKVKAPGAQKGALLRTLEPEVARTSVFGELAAFVESEQNPEATHVATIVFGGRTYGRRAGNADVPILDHGVTSGTIMFCSWAEAQPGERTMFPQSPKVHHHFLDLTPTTVQETVGRPAAEEQVQPAQNSEQSEALPIHNHKQETTVAAAAATSNVEPIYVDAMESPHGQWETATADHVWSLLPPRLAADIESSYVRGEPWFRFQTRGVKHQLDFHASLHEAAPHTLSIGGSTQELKVIRSAGDSIALDRWEFRDPSLDLFCPLPAAAGDALTACKRAGTKHCRYTVGGAVFTATLGAAGSVSDYNAKSGETRDLRQVQLRCGMRVQLPGYDRLPSALGTLAYCGPEKIRGKHRKLVVGVTLDQPSGWNHGTIGGAFYFECTLHHGVLCDPAAVLLVD